MTRHNSSEKVLGYFLVKHSIDFLMASCTFGQVGKWLKVAFGILCPYPMPCFFFFFFFGLLSLVPCLLGLLLDCPPFTLRQNILKPAFLVRDPCTRHFLLNMYLFTPYFLRDLHTSSQSTW